MKDTFDEVDGQGCRPVLAGLDELGRTRIPNLSDHVATVRSRGISILGAVQSPVQLDAAYGNYHARIIRGNMASQIFYRPADYETAGDLQKWFGDKSGFAHSTNTHEDETSEGLSEREIPVMTTQEIMLLEDSEIVGSVSGFRWFRARRMEWWRFPVLVERKQIPPPPLSPLPPLEERQPEKAEQKPKPVTSWRLEPELMSRRKPAPSAMALERRELSNDCHAVSKAQPS